MAIILICDINPKIQLEKFLFENNFISLLEFWLNCENLLVDFDTFVDAGGSKFHC